MDLIVLGQTIGEMSGYDDIDQNHHIYFDFTRNKIGKKFIPDYRGQHLTIDYHNAIVTEIRNTSSKGHTLLAHWWAFDL